MNISATEAIVATGASAGRKIMKCLFDGAGFQRQGATRVTAHAQRCFMEAHVSELPPRASAGTVRRPPTGRY